VGWATADSMPAELVCNALSMVITLRQPKPELLVHTDRGSQYANHAHRSLLGQHGLTARMSRKANCWDTQFTLSSERRPDLIRAGIGGTALALTCRSDRGVPRALSDSTL